MAPRYLARCKERSDQSHDKRHRNILDEDVHCSLARAVCAHTRHPMQSGSRAYDDYTSTARRLAFPKVRESSLHEGDDRENVKDEEEMK